MKVRRGEKVGTGSEGPDSLRPGAEVVRPGKGGSGGASGTGTRPREDGDEGRLAEDLCRVRREKRER